MLYVALIYCMFFVLYVLEESYLNASFLYKVAYMVFAITLVRARYYFAWCLGKNIILRYFYGFYFSLKFNYKFLFSTASVIII